MASVRGTTPDIPQASIVNRMTSLLTHRGLAACFAVIVAVQLAQAFPITVILHMPPPTQLRVEQLWRITLVNTGASPVRAKLFGVAYNENGKWIADGTSRAFDVPRGSTTVSASDISPIDYSGDPAYDDIIRATGTVPAGTYTICVYAIDPVTGDTLGRDCSSSHVVLNVTPPQLIAPGNDDSVRTPVPLFSWSPVAPYASLIDVSYSLKIVEVVGRQSAYDAVQSNPPWFSEADLPVPLCPYPLSAEKFEPGVRYAWQVTAFARDMNGAKGEVAKSEIWGFTVAVQDTPGGVTAADDWEARGISNAKPAGGSGQDTAGVDGQGIGSIGGPAGIVGSAIRVDSQTRVDTLTSIPGLGETPSPDSARNTHGGMTGQDSSKGLGISGAKPDTTAKVAPQDICSVLHAKLTASGQERAYTITIVSKTDSTVKWRPSPSNAPIWPHVAVSINTGGDSITSIDGGPTKGWERTPAKFPPGATKVTWKNSSGIPSGETQLGIIHQRPRPTPVPPIIVEFLDSTAEVLCRDTLYPGVEGTFYELTDEDYGTVVEVPYADLNVEFVNPYASTSDASIIIIDRQTNVPVKSRATRPVPVQSVNGLNRLAIPLPDYGLKAGKSYQLRVPGAKSTFVFNFKIKSDKDTNVR